MYTAMRFSARKTDRQAHHRSGRQKSGAAHDITGSDDGTMNVPKWRENLRFAASLQDAIEQDTPQLTRPIFFCYRKYNMDLTTGSLLWFISTQIHWMKASIQRSLWVNRWPACSMRTAKRNKMLKNKVIIQNVNKRCPSVRHLFLLDPSAFRLARALFLRRYRKRPL